MEYFYTPPPLVAAEHLRIEGDEFAHLTHVMRKRAGDRIHVVDGIGTMYDCTIARVSNNGAYCTIQARRMGLHEPATEVILAFGLLKNPASNDFLVEKTTELGVGSIIPLFTERTLPRHAKVARWQKLALAAMKQCGRCVMPKVREPRPFHAFLASCTQELRLIPHEQVVSPSMVAAVGGKGSRSIAVCIGPEGGFTDQEIDMANAAGFLSVTLGPRRLRAETAAMLAVALAVGS